MTQPSYTFTDARAMANDLLRRVARVTDVPTGTSAASRQATTYSGETDICPGCDCEKVAEDGHRLEVSCG